MNIELLLTVRNKVKKGAGTSSSTLLLAATWMGYCFIYYKYFMNPTPSTTRIECLINPKDKSIVLL